MVDRLRSRRDEIVQAIYASIQEAVPDSVGARDAGYQAGGLAAVAAVLDYVLEAIEYGPVWSAPVPLEAAAQARRAARAGVSVGVVLRRYLVGHRRLGEFVAEETERVGPSNHAVALHHIRRTQEASLERLTAAIEREYDQECQRSARSPEQRRVKLVQRLLDSDSSGQSALADLGYRFDAWHVGMIAAGAGAVQVLQILKADDRQLLPVSHNEQTVWAWLGGQRRPVHADMERIGLGHEAAGVSLALGEPAKGIQGWRETHRQAQEALQVALLGRHKRVRFADIALLTPWVKNPDRGRALVELHLAALNNQKDGGATSYRVLRAYFEAGRNVSAAARKLGLERRTLAYRLETISECLGYALDDRIAVLELAIRLHDLLNADDVQTGKNP